jgi:hypothetical protein
MGLPNFPERPDGFAQLPKSSSALQTFWGDLRRPLRATGIKSHFDTTGCDKISLTYQTPFRILESRESNFPSIEDFPQQGGESSILERNNPYRFSSLTPWGMRSQADSKGGS